MRGVLHSICCRSSLMVFFSASMYAHQGRLIWLSGYQATDHLIIWFDNRDAAYRILTRLLACLLDRLLPCLTMAYVGSSRYASENYWKMGSCINDRSNLQTFKQSNIQTFKHSSLQTVKYSIFQMFKSLIP